MTGGRDAARSNFPRKSRGEEAEGKSVEYSLLSIEGRRNRGGARDADCIRNRLSLPAFRFLFGLRGAFVRESENRRGGRRANSLLIRSKHARYDAFHDPFSRYVSSISLRPLTHLSLITSPFPRFDRLFLRPSFFSLAR